MAAHDWTLGQLRDAGGRVVAADVEHKTARVMRDILIRQAHDDGLTDAAIADACGMDRSRVSRIISAGAGKRATGRRPGA